MEKRRFNVRRNESDRAKQSEVETVWETGQGRHCKKSRQGKRGSEEDTHKGRQQKEDSRKRETEQVRQGKRDSVKESVKNRETE